MRGEICSGGGHRIAVCSGHSSTSRVLRPVSSSRGYHKSSLRVFGLDKNFTINNSRSNRSKICNTVHHNNHDFRIQQRWLSQASGENAATASSSTSADPTPAVPSPRVGNDRILGTEEQQILGREKDLLVALIQTLRDCEATSEDIEYIENARRQLEELFLIVIVGEFNAGKTKFINALLGNKYLKEGVTPTTNVVHIVRYGSQILEEYDVNQDRMLLHLPIPWLKDLNVVDTPGTNAIIRRHQVITEHFVPRSDLILFVTSADRPFSESELEFLERIKQWGKKVVFVINKIDHLADNAQRLEIERFVREGIIQKLGFEPRVFSVSARQALAAKLQGQSYRENSSDWKESRFHDLETFVFSTLDSAERIKLKLESPLGVAAKIVSKYAHNTIDVRLNVLKEDIVTIETIQNQLSLYRGDMLRDFETQKARVDNVLFRLSERGERFFDSYITVSNVRALLSKDDIRSAFEQRVVADTVGQINEHISTMIDWILERKYKQWKAVTDFVHKRAAISASEKQLVGSLNSEFDFNRQNLLLSLGRDAELVMKGFDREAEIALLNQEISAALFQTAAAGMSAIGIGAASLFLMPTLMLDFAGLFGAGALALTAFYIIPYKRSKLKNLFRENVTRLREQLNDQLQAQFLKDVDDSISAINTAISPYSRFIRVESDKFRGIKTRLSEIAEGIDSVRSSISALGTPKS